MKHQQSHITNAIKWARWNRDRIESALPLHTPGRCFGQGWLATLDKYVSLYEAGLLSEYLARCYVQYPLREIREHLTKKPSKHHPKNILISS